MTTELTISPPAGPAGVRQTVPAATAAIVSSDAAEAEIPADGIDADPANARKHFDPEQIRALADSIAAHRLLNAVTVYRQGGRFRLVAGERRLRAVRLLGWTAIRARILPEPPDEATRTEMALIDNVQREDLTDIEFGLACQAYLTRTGGTASALAAKLNKHVSTVTRAVQLVHKLPAEIHELIRSKALPPSAARQLLRLPDDEAKRHFARLYCDGTVKTAAELAAAIKNGAAPSRPAAFTCEENGVRIAVTLPADSLAVAEIALKGLLKDLRDHGSRGLAHFKEYLARKARAARKAAELQNARAFLEEHDAGERQCGR